MLVNSVALREKRDRVNAKGEDGGAFVPRCVLITGTTKSDNSTTIPLPRYINLGNFLGAITMLKSSGTDIWSIIGDFKTKVFEYDFQYNQEDNTIIFDNQDASARNTAFRLTVFYTG